MQSESSELKAFRETASANRGKVTFVSVPPTEGRVLEYFGITAADFVRLPGPLWEEGPSKCHPRLFPSPPCSQPTVILVTMNENEPMKKYKWRSADTIAAAELSTFLSDFFAGSLAPFKKSEAEPCECARGPVCVEVRSRRMCMRKQ